MLAFEKILFHKRATTCRPMKHKSLLKKYSRKAFLAFQKPLKVSFLKRKRETYSEPSKTSNMEHFAKKYFHKKLYLRCLTEFWKGFLKISYTITFLHLLIRFVTKSGDFSSTEDSDLNSQLAVVEIVPTTATSITSSWDTFIGVLVDVNIFLFRK